MAKTNVLDSASLFPILPQALVGMARLAAQSSHADDGHLIEFKAMRARSLLNWSVSKRNLWRCYSINPYRGCEFGCKYCYARYTHEFLQPAPIRAVPAGSCEIPQQPWALAFEREIYLKENAAWLLEQELRRVDKSDEIAIGTATDPYQPIERSARITKGILEVFARREGHRLGIVTKSTLITRDIDLLRTIAAKNHLVLHITVTTANAALARKLEPRAPRPDLRLAAVRKLRDAGLKTGVLCAPLLPGITDSEADVSAVAERAAAEGASFFAANPLFLKSCSRPTYMGFVREHFPHLVADYARRFDHRDFANAEYSQQVRDMVRRLCEKHGLNRRSSDALLTREEDGGELDRKPPTRYGEIPEQIVSQAKLFA